MYCNPNYVGYDAFEGNPRSQRQDNKPRLLTSTAPLKKADFGKLLHTGWIKRLEAVRLWCVQNDCQFCVSPYDFQLAKILSDHSTIVLWSGRAKPSKMPIIKAAFEGPVRHHSHSTAALEAISILVAP